MGAKAFEGVGQSVLIHGLIHGLDLPPQDKVDRRAVAAVLRYLEDVRRRG